MNQQSGYASATLNEQMAMAQKSAFATQQQNSNLGTASAVGAAITLTDQIARAHSMLESLGEVVSSLEKRLSPILSSNYPDGQQEGNAIHSEPPAIEEMERLINRLRTVVGYVDSIERRVRI